MPSGKPREDAAEGVDQPALLAVAWIYQKAGRATSKEGGRRGSSTISIRMFVQAR